MIVFRLSKLKYSKDLSGSGAEKSGGRWNSRGTAMVYTSDSRALCTAEIAVHTPLGNTPSDYYLTTIELPDESGILEFPVSDLPSDWKSFPHSASTQKIGDRFISEAQFLLFKAPSVVVPGDFNYLINPRHTDFSGIKIMNCEPFEFDKRLFER
jgi:RES domain-containing protein